MYVIQVCVCVAKVCVCVWSKCVWVKCVCGSSVWGAKCVRCQVCGGPSVCVGQVCAVAVATKCLPGD